MHSQLPHHHHTTMCHATSTSVLPSHLPNQLPCHILYNPVTLPHQHPYNLVTVQHQHPYSHISSTMPRSICHWGTSCMDCHILFVHCHVSILTGPTQPKNPKLSHMCYLLMFPCVLANVIMMS
jgi:hypothetical protein